MSEALTGEQQDGRQGGELEISTGMPQRVTGWRAGGGNTQGEKQAGSRATHSGDSVESIPPAFQEKRVCQGRAGGRTDEERNH